MSQHVQISIEDGVLEIKFARPEKKNALTNAMYNAACEALEQAEQDASIRVILLTSEGDVFTAGNDLADFANVSSDESVESQAPYFIRAIARASKPLVAAVPGIAVGVGTTMLLHCDLVYVAEGAKLSAPFVNLALVPEAASSLLLPQTIGHVKAFALFALGESLSGNDAVSLGMANKALTTPDDVRAAAKSAASTLAKKPVGSLLATKKLMRDTALLAAHIQQESEIFEQRLSSAEAREAFSAFAERRAPDFSKF